ncbi:hypothetical protein KFE80_12120 [bacterium SCSIO 12696]|nr:hypothetical protein KFE80_12120 [bacterium SCSIO 12696]
MSVLKVVLIACIVSLVACSGEDTKEYSADDAETDFKNDINNEVLHFMYVEDGWGGGDKGVGVLEYELCYKENISFKRIGPVGDYGISPRLQQKAKAYAKAYNLIAKEYFTSKDLNICPSGEEWDSATKFVNEYLLSEYDQTLFYPINDEGNIDIHNLIHISNIEGSDYKAIAAEICSIFKDNGVGRFFGITFEDDLFACENGNLL